MTKKTLNNASAVYFKDSRVVHASNDGMELLGHFLLSQVGADRVHFFEKWLKERPDDNINSGPYFLEKVGDKVYLDHMENERESAIQQVKRKCLRY